MDWILHNIFGVEEAVPPGIVSNHLASILIITFVFTEVVRVKLLWLSGWLG